MHSPTKILIASIDPGRGAVLAGLLSAENELITAAHVEDPRDLHLDAEVFGPDVLVVDGELLERFLPEDVLGRAPEMALVVMSPKVDERQLEVAVRLGAKAVLRSPCQPAHLLELLAAPSPRPEHAGSCGGVATAQLLSLYCAAGYEGVLHLCLEDGRSGGIHLEMGHPIHASCTDPRIRGGREVGPEAVQTMLRWPRARATWLAGRTGCARTIIGRWEGLMGNPVRGLDLDLPMSHPEVMEKLARLAQTPDILGAFLLRNAEVITGRCDSHLDESVMGRALGRLANVFHDVKGQEPHTRGEIQAMLGELRLVVDHVGPDELGYQVGVVVRQASPVCKSLRRLLRQIDKTFKRSLGGRRPDIAPVPENVRPLDLPANASAERVKLSV